MKSEKKFYGISGNILVKIFFRFLSKEKLIPNYKKILWTLKEITNHSKFQERRE